MTQRRGGLAQQLLAVASAGVPANVFPPHIGGVVQVGSVLRWIDGVWSDPSLTYARQWFAAGVAIAGATASTYTPVAGDVGKAITVLTTGTNPSGKAAATLSAATAAIVGSGGSPTSSAGGGSLNNADHTDQNNAYLVAAMAA